MYKLRAFVEDVLLILEDPVRGVELLMKKLKEFGVVAGFKINKQKTKLVTKNMDQNNQLELMNKTDFKVEKKVKYLGVTLTNMNNMLYQKNYVKMWSEIKKKGHFKKG